MIKELWEEMEKVNKLVRDFEKDLPRFKKVTLDTDMIILQKYHLRVNSNISCLLT